MKFNPVLLLVLTLASACSEDKSQNSSANEIAVPVQVQQTPHSLSGSEPHSGPNPHAHLNAEQHIAVAYQHVEEGRIVEALDVLGRAIEHRADDVSLIAARGGLLLSQNRVFDALVDLEKAVKLAPANAELLVNRSQAYLKFNQKQKALEDLDKAISLSPKLVAARFNRGSLLYDQASYQAALADFDICIQVAPQTAGPYFNRAITRDAIGNRNGAIHDLQQFIELSDNPDWNRIASETLNGWRQGNKVMD